MGEGIKTRRGESKGVLDSNTYLYNEGDECTALTGGWDSIINNRSGVAGTATFSKESTYLYAKAESSSSFDWYYSVWKTINSIDLTNYSLFKIEYEVAMSGTQQAYSGFTRLSPTAFTTTSTGTGDADIIEAGNIARHIASVNISALNKSEYIHTFACSFNTQRMAEIKVYKIWLE